jgi:hypothetical protein
MTKSLRRHNTIKAHPKKIAAGGIVLLTAEVPTIPQVEYTIEWIVEGPDRRPHLDVAALGVTTVAGGPLKLECDGSDTIRSTLDTGSLDPGAWKVIARLTPTNGEEPIDLYSDDIEVTPRPFQAGDDVSVTLTRAAVPPTSDQALWVAIRNSANALSFDRYSAFIEALMCGEGDEHVGKRVEHRFGKVKRRTALPFPNVDRYRVLKAATEVFLMTHCGADLQDFDDVDLDEEATRLGRPVTRDELEHQMRHYLKRVARGDGDFLEVVPYLGLIRRQLGDVPVIGSDRGDDDATDVCFGILAERLERPMFLELIHEYWAEEGGLFATMNAILRRFENRRVRGRDPLIGMDIDPLRPLNSLLWGMVQDRQHRLTPRRLAYEFDHHYGLRSSRYAGPPVRGADSRSRFMQAFHELMSLCAVFYTQDDNTTVIADGFPILNALKETHLLLTAGAHNQYNSLPWTARHEALMYQWILASGEMREFLPMRTMVAYPEPWIASVDAMNKLQGWSNTSVVHYRDLSVFGEQLLLGIRFGAWSVVNDPNQAANWARYVRPEMQAFDYARQAVAVGQRGGGRTAADFRQGAPAYR